MPDGDDGVPPLSRGRAVAGQAPGPDASVGNPLVCAYGPEIGGLGYDHPVRPAVREVCEKRSCSFASKLLVCGPGNDDVTPEGAVPENATQRVDERRHSTLRVAGAPPVQSTLLDPWAERLDLHPVDWNRVEMRLDQDGLPGACGPGLRDNGWALGVSNQLGVEAHCAELLPYVLRVAALPDNRWIDIGPPHRIDRRDRDVVAQVADTEGLRHHTRSSAGCPLSSSWCSPPEGRRTPRDPRCRAPAPCRSGSGHRTGHRALA